MDLDGPVDHALGVLGRDEFRQRRLAGDAGRAAVLGPGGAVDEEGGGIDLGRALGDGRLRELEVAERAAEELAAIGMGQRLVQGPPCEAERRGADRRAEDVERRHRDLEPVAGAADAVLDGYAAGLGFARRALHETLERATTRKLFGGTLGDLQLAQAAIAESIAEVEAAALLVYRAAWTKDRGAPRVTREAALAKMIATEIAQRVIDRAVQLHGGLGVTRGVKVEELYREIRALRIYEGATEVQKVVIARDLLKNNGGPDR